MSVRVFLVCYEEMNHSFPCCLGLVDRYGQAAGHIGYGVKLSQGLRVIISMVRFQVLTVASKRWPSSGFLRRVVWWKFTDVLKAFATSIIRVIELVPD
jgi:hypothetical protein